MDSASWIAFSQLVEKNGSSKKNALMKYLPTQEQKKLAQTPPYKGSSFKNPLSTQNRVSQVHYSWLITFLEPFAEKDKALIIAAFDKNQSKKLCTHFKIHENLPSISAYSQTYILNTTYNWLVSKQTNFVPMEFLPTHPLNGLLSLSKSEIQRLVDFLGLHDLAAEIRHVVKTDQIKKIQLMLTDNQQKYMQSLLKGKEPIFFVRLNLDGWDGNKDKLKTILHHRGFNRLAKSIFGCHPSFLWHICHTLDTGRTKILRKFFKNINNEEVHELLIKQVQELIPMVQKEI